MIRTFPARHRAVPAILFLGLLLVAGAQAATGTLSVASVPSGATVYLDGTLLGTTPITSVTVTAGDHAALLTLAGYEDYSATISVPENGSVRGAYTLVPAATKTTTTAATAAPGSLDISSEPSGATVTIDGTVRGTTPLSLSSIAAGDHTVVLSMDGYADLSSTITIPAGGTFTDTYTLSCNILSVSSTPSGATVTIDGTTEGTTPLSLRAVTAGDHTLVLTLDGYDTYTTTVTVIPGIELKVSRNFGSPTTAATATTIRTVATTATPKRTGTLSPGGRPTPKPVTTTATVTQEANCTQYYSGTADPGVTADGRLNCTAVISSSDQVTTLTIPAGTRITVPSGGNGNLSIAPLASAAIPPATGGLVSTGIAAVFQPDGTTFDQPATVAFRLDQASWDRFVQNNLTIATTSGNGWEVLLTTPDPATFSVKAPVQHFSTIGLFTRAEPEAADPAGESVKDTIRNVVSPVNATLPLSPYMPAAAAPVAAVAGGVALTVAGTVAAGSSLLGRSWEQLLTMLKKFVGMETVGLMNVKEVKMRHIAPATNLAEVVFCLSGRELLVLAASIAGFAVAFLLQARLSLVVTTFIIFICAGGLATIFHEIAHKVAAYRFGCQTEYQFWTLGTVTMFFTAWLFGSSFGKPSRTIIASGEKKPTVKENAIIKVAGPLANLGVAIVSLALLPLGGLFTVVGAAGFAMNLLNFVFSLAPIRPNDGVEVYAWNKAVWALLFFPLLFVYLWLYL